MRMIARAIAKIDEQVKTLEALRDRLPEGSDAVGILNGDIELQQKVKAALQAIIDSKPKKDEKKKDKKDKPASDKAAK